MRIRSILVLSAWGGLLAGLLEVGTIVLRKQVFDPDRFYRMSRHFLWLIPLSNLVIFLALGLIGCGIILVWPRQGRRLLPCVLGASMLLPALLVAFPRIYSLALLIVGLGLAAQCVAIVERRRRGFRRFVTVSFPAAIAIVTIMGASLLLVDHRKQARERAHTLPPAGSPNVLLIVLDTVAAGHLGLYGYDRATCPALVEAAEHAIRFDSARATSSWTLPSHASMFTGRWVHELSAGWFTPLDQAHPTVAEFLGKGGYATAGFVANTVYCGTDSGLARGFNWYQDYVFPELTAFKTAVLVDRAIERLRAFTYYSGGWLDSAGLLPLAQRILRSLDDDRKGAAVVNRELLDWLSRRAQPERPFFAFLNYFDAHYPYRLLPGRLHRFGVEPNNKIERALIQRWWGFDKKTVSPEGVAFVTDAYDDCIADLDEQLGKLVDELDRRRVLQRTWLIIASDHGESFGEHPRVFCHGTSLYQTELHVPLLIIPPAGRATKLAVGDAVSLRDLAATIVDVVGQQASSPFPGESLSRFWKPPGSPARIQPSSAVPALAEVVLIEVHNRDYWGVPHQLSPLRAVLEEDWSYIRQAGSVREELFHLSQDPKEQRDLSGDPAAQTTLGRMRRALDGLSGGPLSAERFSH
jgi:arylsulfatase A-like enzyme